MSRSFLLSIILLFSACGQTSTKFAYKVGKVDQNLIGIFHYTYPHNVPGLNEDQYLVFDVQDERITGRYYGTTDEFETNREGYLPGFFVAEIKDFKQEGDAITFNIHPDTSDVFISAIPLSVKSPQQARKEGFKKWDRAEYLDLQRTYSGILKGDSICFKGSIPLFDKCFKKVK